MSAAEAEAHKATGNKALQAKEFDEAIAAYTQAIEVSASLPVSGEGAAPRHVYFSNRSAAYLSKGDAAAALEDAEQCIQANPTWPKGFSRKGAALHAMKQYDEAQAAYEAGLEVAPEDAGLAAALDDVKKAKEGRGQSRVNPLASIFAPENVARLSTHPVFCKYMMDEDFKAKMHLLQTDPSAINTILQDKRVMEVFGFLTGIDMRAGGMEEGEEESAYGGGSSSSSSSNNKQETPAPAPEPADNELTEAERELRKRKREALEAKERGNQHYVKKEFTEALAAYEEAIEKDPSNMAFLTNKAAVFFEQGEYARAVAQCEEAIQVGRSNRAPYADVGKALVRKGKALVKMGDLGGAVEAFRNAQMEHFDKTVERLIKTTEVERKKKEEAAYIDPAKAVEAKDRGNEAFRGGQWPDAVKEYGEAIKRDPTNAAYHNNLAAALSKLMDFPAAKAACEKAIAIDPKYVKAWAKKGDIEFFMKEYHRALESYKHGLEIEPNNSLCTQGLQKTMMKIRESSSEEADMERAAHGMADPEIQAILSDPVIQQVLRDVQENPREGQKAMSDPGVAAKIEKLINAGVLRTK
jgi:stress-induced-phosphoprotein 1